jgi:hypothetical protein
LTADAIVLCLALVLAIASTAKIYDSRGLRDALHLGGLNDVLVGVLARLLPVAELMVAGALIVGSPASVRVALLTAACLFAAFTLWILVMLGRGLRPACGCFGVADESLGARSVGRNLVLLALAGTALLLRRGAQPLLSPSLVSLITVTAGLTIVALGTALALNAQLVRKSSEAAAGGS